MNRYNKLLIMILLLSLTSQSHTMMKRAAGRLGSIQSFVTRQAASLKATRSFARPLATRSFLCRPSSNIFAQPSLFSPWAKKAALCGAFSSLAYASLSQAQSEGAKKSALSIGSDGKALIDFTQLKLENPKSIFYSGLLIMPIGSIVGNSLIANTPQDTPPNKLPGIIIGGLISGGLGLLFDLSWNKKEKTIYQKTQGYNIFGAAALDNIESIITLIENGSSGSDQDAQGRTPLMYACAAGAENATRLLLANTEKYSFDKAKPKCLQKIIDVKDNHGMTALNWAEKCNQPKIVTILLEHNKPKPATPKK
jgi:ankyrin repeat protein